MKTEKKKTRNKLFFAMLLTFLLCMIVIPKSISAAYSQSIREMSVRRAKKSIVIVHWKDRYNEDICKYKFETVVYIEEKDNEYGQNSGVLASRVIYDEYNTGYYAYMATHPYHCIDVYLVNQERDSDIGFKIEKGYGWGDGYIWCGKEEPHKHYINDLCEVEAYSGSFDDSIYSMEIGESFDIGFNVINCDKNLSWASSDEEIASVSKAGVITAKKPGTFYLQLKVDGCLAYQKLIKVKKYKLSATELKLYSGEKAEISFGGPVDAIWSSSDKKIATVENGIVTARKPGETEINVKIDGNSFKCSVKVFKSYLPKNTLEVTLGGDIPSYVIGSSVEPLIKSSNENVVTIINGKPTITGVGKTTVSYTIGDEVLKCKVKVKKAPAPTGITYQSSSSVIKLAWDEYEGAKNFSVYMYDAEEQAYTLLEYSKKTSCTIEDLEAGKTYIFRIAANVKVNDNLIEQTLSDKIKCKTEKKDKIGWQTIDGKKCYYKNGFAIDGGIQKIDSSKYIFDTDGSLITGRFSTINGSKYYSDSNGKVVVNKEVTDSENNITYVADSEGVLTKKKKSSSTTKTSTKSITFNDVTMDIPTSWGSQYKDGDAINYYFGNSTVMIYTDPKSGSLTQSKADWLVDEFDEYCCTSLDVTKSKKYTYENKKISAYYIYNLDLKIPNYSGTKSTPFKGRLTAFEYNGKYYVAVIMVEKSSYNENSFDDYAEMVKSIKPVTKSTGGSGTKKTTSSTTVWVTENGSHYHRIKNCGNGYYWEEDLETAKKRGLTPCGKCF